MLYDAFICHASEDKDVVARPIAKELASHGLRVWFDENDLRLGDSLRSTLDNGLAQSEWGIVILSPAFFRKNWPVKELDALAAREARDGSKLILPIWHNTDQRGIAEFSQMLASRVGISFSRGLAAVVDAIRMAMNVAPGAHTPKPPTPPLKSRRNPDGSYTYRVRGRGFQDAVNELITPITRNGSTGPIGSVMTEHDKWTQFEFTYSGPWPPDRVEVLAMKHGVAIDIDAPPLERQPE